MRHSTFNTLVCDGKRRGELSLLRGTRGKKKKTKKREEVVMVEGSKREEEGGMKGSRVADKTTIELLHLIKIIMIQFLGFYPNVHNQVSAEMKHLSMVNREVIIIIVTSSSSFLSSLLLLFLLVFKDRTKLFAG